MPFWYRLRATSRRRPASAKSSARMLRLRMQMSQCGRSTDSSILMPRQRRVPPGWISSQASSRMREMSVTRSQRSRIQSAALSKRFPIRTFRLRDGDLARLMKSSMILTGRNSRMHAWHAEPVPSSARPASAMTSRTSIPVTASRDTAAGTVACTLTSR